MGKKSDLSPRKIGIAQTLLDEGQYSQVEIAKRLKISQKSVSRINKCRLERSVYEQNRAGKCGRKQKFSPRSLRTLTNMALRNRKLTSNELRINMLEYGVDASSRTVRRKLHSEGLRACRPRKKAKITPTMAKNRLEWAKGLQHWTAVDWQKVNSQFTYLFLGITVNIG